LVVRNRWGDRWEKGIIRVYGYGRAPGWDEVFTPYGDAVTVRDERIKKYRFVACIGTQVEIETTVIQYHALQALPL